MSSYTYKNETKEKLVVIGVGEVEAGGTITVDREINNPNLTLVDTKEKRQVKKTGDK